jgi:hypothetical protein
MKPLIIDGFVKSPFAALRFTFVVAAYLLSTPHSSGFARLAPGAFYFAVPILTFHEIVIIGKSQLLISLKTTILNPP